MVIIYVDGKMFEVDGVDNFLQVCLFFGFDIFYFCWYLVFGSVGVCCQCVVKQYIDENDKCGCFVMFCMIFVIDNIWIFIEDEEVKQFCVSVVEWLMINYLYDCLVCEEGGYCYLQDMMVMIGYNECWYCFIKCIYQNQEFGLFIVYEMNCCIVCYCCVCYYKDYVGGIDFGVYGVYDNVYFGWVEDGVLESEFFGNFIEVCFIGVFIDKIYFECYNCKWDMQFVLSICYGCFSGCNISFGECYGEICCIENCYNGLVNYYFFCDCGCFGYGYVNCEDCLCQLLLVLSKQKLSLDGVFDQVVVLLKECKVVGIGLLCVSLESNFVLCELVGEGNFYSGINEGEFDCLCLILQVMQEGLLLVLSICDIEDYDVVFVFGEDLIQIVVCIVLVLCQLVKGKVVEMVVDMKVQLWFDVVVKNIVQYVQNLLFIVSVSVICFDDVVEEIVYVVLDDFVCFGFVVVYVIDLSVLFVVDFDLQVQVFVQCIVDVLLVVKCLLVVFGNLLGNKVLIEVVVNIVKVFKQCEKNGFISLVVGEVNSFGLVFFGGDFVEVVFE